MSRHHCLVTGLLVLSIFCLAVGCSPATTPVPAASPTALPVSPTLPASTRTAPAPPSSTSIPAPTATATAAPLQVVDSAGRTVTLSGPPQRIISLAPSNTEILFALGLDHQIVAVDEFSDYPPAAAKLPKITKGFQPNFEQIVAYKPDLVLAAGITAPDALQKLEELKLPYAVFGPVNTKLQDIPDQILRVGQLTGRLDHAQQVTAAMQARQKEIVARVAQATTHPRVYWELDATDVTKPYTPGPGSFVDELITSAGGTNVAGSAPSPYVQFSSEEIIRANPEVIILSDAAYGVTVDSVVSRPGWNVIDAVKNKRVSGIDDNLVSRPGPRVTDGLEAAARLIHPELFP